MIDPLFLTLDEVLGIHAGQIRRYGGRPGLRDLGLLQSAAAIPETTCEGEFLHGTVFEIAAMKKTFVFPVDPWFNFGDPRLLLALIFLVVGFARSAPRKS